MHNSVTLLLARCFVFGGVIGITLVLIEAEGYAANVLANTEGAVISRIGLVASQLTVVSLSAIVFVDGFFPELDTFRDYLACYPFDTLACHCGTYI